MKKALFLIATLLAAMFLPAGRWDWAAGWWCLGINVVGFSVAVALFLYFRNPGLLRRRTKAGRGTPAWDLGLVLIVQVAYLLQLVVASLDQGRVNGGPSPVMWWIGLAALGVGGLGLAAALTSNPYFESTVRHQKDQGQQIVSGGPYAVIRHPGYTFALIYMLSFSISTGSYWSLGAWLIECGVFSTRCLLEEEFLLKAFPDTYKAYQAKVRYRLIPGLW